MAGEALGQHQQRLFCVAGTDDGVHLPVTEGVAIVDFGRTVFDALARGRPGDSDLALGLLLLGLLREVCVGDPAEHSELDVAVEGRLADRARELEAEALDLSEDGAGAVLLVGDLRLDVFREGVVVPELDRGVLGLQVLPVVGVGDIRAVPDLGGVVTVQVLIGAALQLPVDGTDVEAELVGRFLLGFAGLDFLLQSDAIGEAHVLEFWLCFCFLHGEDPPCRIE